MSSLEDQFRCVDLPTRPQVVRLDFSCVTCDPDHAAGPPDADDEGFWPSRDPAAAGFVGEANLARFDELHAAAQQRFAAWERGDWGYVGVSARCVAHVPIGQGAFAVYTFNSPGLWGVESDSDPAYIAEVYAEQRAELVAHLRALALHVVALPPEPPTNDGQLQGVA